jgi:hypothetical protein
LLLVSLFGYIGAAIAAVATVYFWSVPISIWVIAREYKVRLAEVLPYADLTKILAVSALASVVFLPGLFLKGANDILRLSIFSPIYSVTVVALFVSLKLVDKTSISNAIFRLAGLNFPRR